MAHAIPISQNPVCTVTGHHVYFAVMPLPEPIMRAIFSILSLLVVVALVGMLAKKQLHAVSDIHPAVPANTPGSLPTTAPEATVQQQSLQVQQQVKRSVEESLQQTRPVPDDK
jgi:hypothetical protein